jgi:hypothetical protein
VASLRECFLATAAAQQTNAILTIDLANHEIALSWASSILAFGMDTGSSGEVGSWHDVLLANQLNACWRTTYDLTRLFG